MRSFPPLAVQVVVAAGAGNDVVAACRGIERVGTSSQRVAGEFSAIERHRFDLVGRSCTKFVDDGDRVVVVGDQKIVNRSIQVSVDTLKIEIRERGADGGRDLDDVAAGPSQYGLVDKIVAAAGEVKLICVVARATEEIIGARAADELIFAVASGRYTRNRKSGLTDRGYRSRRY